MKIFFTSLFLLLITANHYAQIDIPCSHEAIMERHLAFDADAEEALIQTEANLKTILEDLKNNPQSTNVSSIVIPVVMHVFHVGDDGKMGMEQALSGLEILNNDFNGLNDGWNTIPTLFDNIKGTLDITFCLATIDPDGNPTTGLIYHEDEDGINNEGNLFQHAWDNYKYLNIYFPKYTQGGPSLFTAYAYYPNTARTEANQDGIFYSSIRWGYGEHSELEEGADWASVCSHEAGHWLNLRHTFENGCTGLGDFVDDTPPTLGGTIELEGCNNNNMSCGEITNGSNFMDYNHDCKKMFTQGQIDRMTAALFLPSRINLWSEENLIATGCIDFFTSNEEISTKADIKVFPNPVQNELNFSTTAGPMEISIYNTQGQLINFYTTSNSKYQANVSHYSAGLYFYTVAVDGKLAQGKFVVE